MNKRKLFYKDISGLRFVGIIFIFIYIISYILFSKESPKIGTQYGPLIDTLKNLSISLFFIISAFLLTAHGLREYKYHDKFNLKNFYFRRLLRLIPTLALALIFYFIVHPLIVNFLHLKPLIEISSIKQLIFFPDYHMKISNEVFIYLIFIYGMLIVLQYYALWGLILKFLRSYIIIAMVVLFMIGVVFKSLPSDTDFSPYLYLPYYFLELAIGGIVAVIVRNKSSLISYIKTMSSSKIALIYNLAILSSLAIYLTTHSIYFVLLAKIILYATAGFYIIEQTYAKHSPIKLRNSQFVIEFGNLSYSFIIFSPIIAVTILIALESIEIDINSRLLLVIYPLSCFILTWFTSFLVHHYIDQFFERIRRTFRLV